MPICNKAAAASAGSTEYVVWCTENTGAPLCTLTKNFTGQLQMACAYGKVCFNDSLVFCASAQGDFLPSCAGCIFIPCGTKISTTCPGMIFWGCLTDA